MRARADAGARAASSTSTSISSEDSIDVDVNSPRARELAKLPELDGINGATQDYVIALAECDKSIEVAGRLPDYEAAYRQVKSAHGLLGPEKLQVVFMQWELALQSKTMKNPLKSFGNFVQNAVERKQPAPKSTLKGSGVKNFSGLLMQQNGGNDA